MSRTSSPLALAALLLGGGAPARAQVTAEPESLRVVLVQGAEATHTVTLSNGGAAAFPFCLDVLRPGQAHHPPGALGAGCGPPGELLATIDRYDLGFGWGPLSLAMTPDGRLFTAASGGTNRTYELTADLTYVRRFTHPTLAELAPFPNTWGLTYDPRRGTLWWTNAEVSGFEVRRVTLLEGTLGGVATGRRLQLHVPPGPPPGNTGAPLGAAYDPVGDRLYYVDALRNDLWAADTTGAVLAGYPVRLARYPTAYLGNGADAFGGEAGGDPADVRLEVLVGLVEENEYDRVVVTDAQGRDLGAETPLPPFVDGRGFAQGWSLRSRVDPNGVMYVTYSGRNAEDVPVPGVAAVRPVPLSPTWLALSAWRGSVEGGASAEVTLTFRAGDRAPGVYRSTLVVEDAAGVVLASVPLVLVVEETTPTEPGPDAAPLTLAVAPNPVVGAATVSLVMEHPSPVRVSVYDALGREVALLHDSPLPAGATVLPFDASALPPGVYLVRATGGGLALSRTVTVAR